MLISVLAWEGELTFIFAEDWNIGLNAENCCSACSEGGKCIGEGNLTLFWSDLPKEMPVSSGRTRNAVLTIVDRQNIPPLTRKRYQPRRRAASLPPPPPPLCSLHNLEAIEKTAEEKVQKMMTDSNKKTWTLSDEINSPSIEIFLWVFFFFHILILAEHFPTLL